MLRKKLHFAERITAHKTPLNMHYWRGFSFLFEILMTDRVQAKKDLQFCCDEPSKYQNLSRTGLRHSELVAMDNIMIRLKEQIKNLREALLIF
jgi:hypothetical protein